MYACSTEIMIRQYQELMSQLVFVQVQDLQQYRSLTLDRSRSLIVSGNTCK